MKHKIIFSLLALVLILSLVIPGCAQEKEKHVVFGTGAWSGDWLPVYPVKILLEEEFGYTAEIADLAVAATWAAMAAGEVDLWMASWQPNQEDLKAKYAATTEELGLIYGDCLQGLLVPKSVSEQYGITSVDDLKDPEIAKLFDDDGDDIGDIMGCDAAWKCAKIVDEQIAGYELGNLYEQKYGAEAMMTAAIEGKLKKNEPVLFYFYTPHPFFVRYPVGESVVWLDDPKDFWPVANVYTFGNKDWIKENPKAAKLCGLIEMTEDDVGWSMAEIEARGDDSATLEAIAREWIAAHQSEVDAWVEAAK